MGSCETHRLGVPLSPNLRRMSVQRVAPFTTIVPVTACLQGSYVETSKVNGTVFGLTWRREPRMLPRLTLG